jgi:hypothetical protein
VPQANGGFTLPLTDRNQLTAEYAQICYLKMRRVERSYVLVNYFDPKQNPAVAQLLRKDPEYDGEVAKKRRNDAVRIILKLHERKKYRLETLFEAISLFDEYLLLEGHWNILVNGFANLAIVCIGIAAKFEEPGPTRFTCFLDSLPKNYSECIKVEELRELEFKLISSLSFDLARPQLVSFMERFLRLLNLDKTELFCDLAF